MTDLDLTRYEGHTPGPWSPDPYYPIYVWSGEAMVADLPSEGDEETYLARMRGVGRGATSAEQQANARLIADAPLLLAEVRRLREERAAALSVTTREGLLASEWLLRTGLAESKLAALRQSHARLLEAIKADAYRIMRDGSLCWCEPTSDPHEWWCVDIRAAVAEAEGL